MESKLMDGMNFKMPPVAIYFTDEKPQEALQFDEGKRGCVASMLIAASKGKVVVFDENTYGCAGGGVGLCFGDTFTANNHPTEALLSNGDPEIAARGGSTAKIFATGERFFATPELVSRWKKSFPYTQAPTDYVVFRPYTSVDREDPPHLVMIFANPDQLSALVIMAGFHRGTSLNVLAPFGATCHAIVQAYQQIGKAEPKAIMGYFDISNRNLIPKEILSLTMPWEMFAEIDGSADEGCLTTHAWDEIADRFVGMGKG